jgi:hypothetical protein
MGDETPVTSLILPVLIRPILSQLEKQDISASQTLRSALTKAEASYPGLTHDLVIGIMRKGDLTVNLNESILRLQGAASETDGNRNNICEFHLTVSSCRVPTEQIRGRFPGTEPQIRRPQTDLEPDP